MPRICVPLTIAAFATLAGGLVPNDDRSAELLASQQTATKPAAEAPLTGAARIRSDAEALKELVTTDLARAFLNAAPSLPEFAPRMLYRDPATRQWLSKEQADALPDEKREALTAMEATADVYYTTKYGSPLAYSRAMEILGRHGVESLAGKRILDFGYGTVGHLRLMAACGANAVGVDVDPFLVALYNQPEDQGQVQPRMEMKGGTMLIADRESPIGSVKLLFGRFPAEETTTKAVGGGYDIIISKNTLKRGYVNPPAEELDKIDKRMLIDLGVDDEAFLDSLRDALKSDGLLLIYNLSPKMPGPDEPYSPMCDGRCPWDQAMLEKHGFTVVVYDSIDDDTAARAMARVLGWDAANEDSSPGMNLEKDLFSHYTLARRN